MKKTQTKCIFVILWGITTLTLIIAGCATSVSFQVQRPPTLNTLGIQRLAVMPFSASGGSLQSQAAVWLTNESLARIQATGHFTMVNSSEVERVRSARGNLEDVADALFSGQVVSTTSKDSTSQGSYKDKSGRVITYTNYHREVSITYNYGITRTRDGSMVGPISKTHSTGSTSRSSGELSSAETMIQGLIQRSLAGLYRDVAPYMATEKRSFMKETSKDKVVQQRVKDADALVKTGSYKSAQNAFLNIYQDTGSFAAAYNAALLIEIQGDLEGAAALMQRVQSDTGNPTAATEVARLRKELENAGLLEAYTANQSRRDKVIALMVETLPSKLPNNARVAFINNSQNEKDLAETVTNGIIDGFISKKITIIDRNNRALANMERNYQLSGNVSDEEMVSIGREAGVNTFVLVSITGTGGSRRLSVRLLDIERSTILYQSPQTDEMNL
jgi:hypothetical protein